MDYSKLLDLATDLGYRLAMCGAETYRVEESIRHIMHAYDIRAEVFAIPNCLTVSIERPDGTPITRMCRIGMHDNDLDAVERYSGLGRRICASRPDPDTARLWLQEADRTRRYYSLPLYLLGTFLGALGFCVMFGGTWIDALCAGFCGILVGLINRLMAKLEANQFFRIIAASFLMALPAYGLATMGIAGNADTVIIGTLMILVPGLLFTNAMRDIIYGDTNSGINRIVQVILIALAIALGTATAWNVSSHLWGAAPLGLHVSYGILWNAVACTIGCIGFAVLFNIHGPGILICAFGGMLTYLVYLITLNLGQDDLTAYFFATLCASLYSEAMARIRKYPAISYLVISIFPLIPGAGVYFTLNHAVKGNMDAFAAQGMHTAAIAGIMAVAILLVSTLVRIITLQQQKRKTS